MNSASRNQVRRDSNRPRGSHHLDGLAAVQASVSGGMEGEMASAIPSTVSPVSVDSRGNVGVVSDTPPSTRHFDLGEVDPQPYNHGGQKREYNTGEIRKSIDCNSLCNSEISVDWLSATGPIEHLSDVRFLLDHYTEMDSIESGRYGYLRIEKYVNGALLYIGHKSESSAVLLELKGTPCTIMGASTVWKIGEILARMGWKFTRIDIRRDSHRGEGEPEITLVRDIEDACRKNLMKNLRSWRPVPEYTSTGKVLGHTVYMGSKKSNKFARVYDKGLEQNEFEAGNWIRFESQFRKEYANHVAMKVFKADPLDWWITALEMMLGVVDFYEGKQLRDSVRCEFWESYIGDIEVEKIRIAPPSPTLDGSVRWVRDTFKFMKSVMIMAGASNNPVTMQHFIDTFVGDINHSESAMKSEAAKEMASILRRNLSNEIPI